VQDSLNDGSYCRYDQLTYLATKKHIREHHPRVVLLSLGETDEFAHQKKYDRYLQQAHAIDQMIAELWYEIQSDPFYKNNTSILITTDHGRGRKSRTWFTHNLFVGGSGEVWQAMMGPGIDALGEIRQPQQVYQKQVAATIANWLGEEFKTSPKPAEAMRLPKITTTSAVVLLKSDSVTGGEK
jgi:predicted AlkP superfamily pyrophosphatase or phosphodiesterase